MTFNNPLPIPENAVALTDAEKKVIAKHLNRYKRAAHEADQAHEALNDIAMSIAQRAGRTEAQFAISADLGCLIPKE